MKKMRYSRFLHFSQQIRKTLTGSNPQSLLQSRTSSLFLRNFSTASSDDPNLVVAKSEKVSAIVDELTGLTLLEVMDLVDVMQKKKGINELPLMMLMRPGMELGGLKGALKMKGGSAASAKEAVEEKKEAEKTAFDVKLEAFDAASKIKVIKEVRTFTSLGLKEAKELVEKAPTLLKKGVTKEEAETIIAKMKEVGAKVSME